MFVNGVPQEQGRDYELVGRELLFDRPLEKERLSKGKWTAIFFGLWGSYGKNDSVDVQYRRGGRELVATGLDIIPPDRTLADPTLGPDLQGSTPTLTRSC